MAKGFKMRVNIPRNIRELITLATAIFAKHIADGVASPLNILADIVWADEGSKIQQALDKHNEAEMHKMLMEKAYRERDLILKNTPAIVKNSRDLLTGIHRENMKRLSDWGFSVTDHKRNKKANEEPSESKLENKINNSNI
jgi:hypothetical protein